MERPIKPVWPWTTPPSTIRLLLHAELVRPSADRAAPAPGPLAGVAVLVLPAAPGLSAAARPVGVAGPYQPAARLLRAVAAGGGAAAVHDRDVPVGAPGHARFGPRHRRERGWRAAAAALDARPAPDRGHRHRAAAVLRLLRGLGHAEERPAGLQPRLPPRQHRPEPHGAAERDRDPDLHPADLGAAALQPVAARQDPLGAVVGDGHGVRGLLGLPRPVRDLTMDGPGLGLVERPRRGRRLVGLVGGPALLVRAAAAAEGLAGAAAGPAARRPCWSRPCRCCGWRSRR